MTNKIQELTVNEVWRDEQDAWNHRSEYFVEMHNREDRKAQVTDFLAFLRMKIYYLHRMVVHLM